MVESLPQIPTQMVSRTSKKPIIVFFGWTIKSEYTSQNTNYNVIGMHYNISLDICLKRCLIIEVKLDKYDAKLTYEFTNNALPINILSVCHYSH